MSGRSRVRPRRALWRGKNPDEGSFLAAWLSWLERSIHIREVPGSNPGAATKNSPFACYFHFKRVML